MYVWVTALILVAVALVVRRPIHDEPAFGVFFGFQVTDFDLLFVFVLRHISFAALGLLLMFFLRHRLTHARLGRFPLRGCL